MATRTIVVTEETYSRIVEELTNAKNAIECVADDEGEDLDDPDCDHELVAEWKEIAEALRELGA